MCLCDNCARVFKPSLRNRGAWGRGLASLRFSRVLTKALMGIIFIGLSLHVSRVPSAIEVQPRFRPSALNLNPICPWYPQFDRVAVKELKIDLPQEGTPAISYIIYTHTIVTW